MYHKKNPQNTANSVVPGQNFEIPISIGEMIHAIFLEMSVKNTGVPPSISDIASNIKFLRNGNVCREMLATELDAINAYDSESLRMNIDGCTGQIYGVITPPTIAGSGTGFAVGDTLTLVGTGGTLANLPGAAQAKFVVTTVSSGNITGLRVVNPGQYAIIPTAFTYTTSGGGATNTLTPTFAVLTAIGPNAFAAFVESASVIPAVGDTATFRIGIYFADASRDTASEGNVYAFPTAFPDPTNLSNVVPLKSATVVIAVPNNANCSGHSIKCYTETTEELGALVDANGNLAVRVFNANGTPVLQPLSANGFNVASAQPYTKMVLWKRAPVGYTAAGDRLIQPERRGDDILQSIHLFGQPADLLQSCVVIYNGKTILNLAKAMNDEINVRRGMNELGLDPLRYDLVFDNIHSLDGLPMINSTQLDVTPNLSAAGATTKTVNMIRRIYGVPS